MQFGLGFSNGSTANRLTGATSPVTTVPCTIVAWTKRYSGGLSSNRVHCGQSGTNNSAFSIQLDASGNVAATRTTSAGTNAAATTSGAVAQLGVWTHMAGVFASITDRRAFLNGGQKATNATSGAASPSTFVGINTSGTTANAQESTFHSVAVWNVALDDAEIAALALGAYPPRIQGANLVFFPFPLGIDQTLYDRYSNQRLTRSSDTFATAVVDFDFPQCCANWPSNQRKYWKFGFVAATADALMGQACL